MQIRPLAAAFALFFMLVPRAPAALAEELSEVNRLHHAGQSSEALERADRYLAAQPKDAQMRFLKSVILADGGRIEDAQGVLRQLTQDYPELAEPHNNLAALAAQRGDYGMARAELEEAVRLNPSYAPARENLGDVFVMLAAEAYGRAQRLEPASPSLSRKIALARQIAIPVGQPVVAESPPASAASARSGRKKFKS